MDLLNLVLNSQYGMVILGVVLVAVIVVFAFLAKTLFPDNSAELKEKLLAQSRILISKASKLLEDGYPDQAVIQAHNAMEQVFKALLKDNRVTTFDAINRLKGKSLLNAVNVDKAHQLRIHRNKAAHGNSNIQPAQARILVSSAVSVITQLLKP
jgi:hypothetical protein